MTDEEKRDCYCVVYTTQTGAQLVLEDRPLEPVEFHVWRQQLTEQAAARGYIETRASEHMHQVSWVGPGISLGFLTLEQLEKQRRASLVAHAQRQSQAMPPSRIIT